MTILIIGTPDSGKSEKAEALAMELAIGQKKYYIATMIPYGEEGARRVEKHRRLREGKGFITIEKATAVHELSRGIPDLKESTCLLECMSNLIGNEMHKIDQSNKTNLAAGIVDSVMEMAESAGNLVIVSNRFPLEDDSYDEDTRKYVRLVSQVNEVLSSKVDKVYELREGSGEWTEWENN